MATSKDTQAGVPKKRTTPDDEVRISDNTLREKEKMSVQEARRIKALENHKESKGSWNKQNRDRE